MGVDPFTLGYIAIIAGSALSQASAQREEGKAAKAASEYNAALDDIDAELAKKGAKFEEGLLTEEIERDIGAARAVAGAQGFATESITNQKVFADIRRSGAIDKAIIRTQGSISSFRAKAGAKIERFTGAQAEIAGRRRSFATILRGGAQIAGALS